MSNATWARPGGLRTFYALAATQAFSLIGSRMTAVAVGVWVFAETGRTAPLLLAAFLLEIPGMLVGSLAGVLVDRWPRKPVLILSRRGQGGGRWGPCSAADRARGWGCCWRRQASACWRRRR